MDESIVQELQQTIRGTVICPHDAAYDESRRVWNWMIDKRPAVIVRCSGVADVIDTVNLARRHDLLLAVRGGGHNVAGNAVCDNGIMLDLSLMRAVRIDAQSGIAWVQGGATLGDVDREAQAFGLVVPAGVVSETGIAGLALGGGFGWLRGKHGLTIDNMLSVDIVTADGQFLRASETANADLFWAVRGGGGNFGIVTAFEFRLHPLGPKVMLCAPFYPGEQARQVLQGWREFMRKAPDEFTTEFILWSFPAHPNFPEALHGKPMLVPAGVYAGPVEEGARFVQPLRKLGTPLLDLSGPTPFTKVQQLFDPYVNKKRRMLNYWKSLYLDRFSDEVMDELVAVYNERPVSSALLVLQDLRGASSRVAAEATAFGDRSMPYMLEINTSWSDAQETERNIAWTRDVWARMRRFSTGGLYLNMFIGDGEESRDVVRSTYAGNLKRLVAVKDKYDPANLFRLNQNIRPTA